MLEKGESVMAVRRFDIEADLIPLGVKLNIPPFCKNKSQLSEKEMVETHCIPLVHIHVERAMEHIKNYHTFEKDIPSSLTDLAGQIFKPGMHSLWPCVPGFLKLLWFMRQYVCLCVHLRGY